MREGTNRGGYPGMNWEGQTGVCDAETDMAIHIANSWDTAQNFWVKCEGHTFVWCRDLETDQGTEAEIEGVQ